MYKLLITTYLFLVIGCTNKETNSVQLQEIVLKGENSEVCEKIPEYKFIPLETRPDNLIGMIDKVEIYNDKIYIIDPYTSKTVQVYDINGNYISQIGHRGGGPAEYVTPYHFHLDKENQTITIIDQMKYRALIYDLNTYQHILTKDLPFYFGSYMQLADKSYAWFHLAGFKQARNEYYIQITDSTYRNGSFFLDAQFTSSVGIWTNNTFYRNGDQTYFFTPFNPIIYKINSQEVTPAYKLSIESSKFPPTDFLRSIAGDGSQNYSRDLLTSDYVSAYSVCETDNFMVVTYLIKNKIQVGIYNKHEKKSYTYPDFTDKLLLKGMNLPFIGTYQDYFISSISPESLKYNYIKQDELRSIAANLSEDDNPVLCLIKFN